MKIKNLLSERRIPTAVVALAAALAISTTGRAHPEGPGNSSISKAETYRRIRQENMERPIAGIGGHGQCVDGWAAGTFPCKNIDLLSHLALSDLGVTYVSDIWGWSDEEQEREYVLMGGYEGTVFVDVTHPYEPVVLGMLPAPQRSDGRRSGSGWRDIKVFDDHAFVVSEQRGGGLQVFDLRRLREVDRAAGYATFGADARFRGFGSAHNLMLNEDTGFAYVVGSDVCRGLYIVDVRRPQAPAYVDCFNEHNYVHDTQCVVYDGPDERYEDHEICFSSTDRFDWKVWRYDTRISILDVTDKANLKPLAHVRYNHTAPWSYSHQGWLTPDHAHFLHNDELERFGGTKYSTVRIWDTSDLEAPQLVAATNNGETSITHNLYNRGDFMYQSNYTTGLRIADTREVAKGRLPEVGFFDVYPEHDSPVFRGSWSNYPFFEEFDGSVVAVGSMDRGLFVLQANLPDDGDEALESAPPPAPDARAVASLVDTAGSSIAGTATFSQRGDVVTLVVEIQNCPPGSHAVHLHAAKSCEHGGTAAGGHWIPNGEILGQFICGADGTARHEVKRRSSVWTVGQPGSRDVTLRSIVVHAFGEPRPGARLACGLINRQ